MSYKKQIMLGILLSLLVIGCDRSQQVASPNGSISVRTEISGDEAGPTKRLCVILIFEDSKGSIKRIQTGASDTMKWALDWHDDDTLILYSSDIGSTAYDIHKLELSERRPDKIESNTGREAYRKRYGELPKYN